MKVKDLKKKLNKLNPDSNIWFEVDLPSALKKYLDLPGGAVLDLSDPVLKDEYTSEKHPEDNHLFCTFKAKSR